MTIKPIETAFDGYKFRSRLEARWAVFFKTLGIPYEYEKEGYNLDGTWYLPDFWLPQQKWWIEVKGQKPIDEERRKASLLSDATHANVSIFFGSIDITPPYCDSYTYGLDPLWDWMWCECPICHQLELTYCGQLKRLSCSCFLSIYNPLLKTLKEKFKERWNVQYAKAFAVLNGSEDLQFSRYGTNLRVDSPTKPLKENYIKLLTSVKSFLLDIVDERDILIGYDSPRLIEAYTAARQARFEHHDRQT